MSCTDKPLVEQSLQEHKNLRLHPRLFLVWISAMAQSCRSAKALIMRLVGQASVGHRFSSLAIAEGDRSVLPGMTTANGTEARTPLKSAIQPHPVHNVSSAGRGCAQASCDQFGGPFERRIFSPLWYLRLET